MSADAAKDEAIDHDFRAWERISGSEPYGVTVAQSCTYERSWLEMARAEAEVAPMIVAAVDTRLETGSRPAISD